MGILSPSVSLVVKRNERHRPVNYPSLWLGKMHEWAIGFNIVYDIKHVLINTKTFIFLPFLLYSQACLNTRVSLWNWPCYMCRVRWNLKSQAMHTAVFTREAQHAQILIGYDRTWMAQRCTSCACFKTQTRGIRLFFPSSGYLMFERWSGNRQISGQSAIMMRDFKQYKRSWLMQMPPCLWGLWSTNKRYPATIKRSQCQIYMSQRLAIMGH